MDEQLIFDLANLKAKQLGFHKFSLVPRDYVVAAGSSRTVKSFNQYNFILNCPEGISVSSYTGEYDKENPNHQENIYDHTGVIEITNHQDEDLSIRFLSLILIEDREKPALAAYKLTDQQLLDASANGFQSASDYIKWKLKGTMPEITFSGVSGITNPVGTYRLTQEEATEARNKNISPSEYLRLKINSMA